jgi:hypothetical protein
MCIMKFMNIAREHCTSKIRIIFIVHVRSMGLYNSAQIPSQNSIDRGGSLIPPADQHRCTTLSHACKLFAEMLGKRCKSCRSPLRPSSNTGDFRQLCWLPKAQIIWKLKTLSLIPFPVSILFVLHQIYSSLLPFEESNTRNWIKFSGKHCPSLIFSGGDKYY